MGFRAMSVAMAFAAATTCCSQTWAQTAERPVFKVGDTWTYRDTEGTRFGSVGTYISTETRTVIEILPDEFVMSVVTTTDKGEEKTGRSRNSLDFNSYARPDPNVPRKEVKAWRWPVEVGRVWKYEVPVAFGTQVWEVRVKAWEEVEVPAGKFKALRVERELIANPNPIVGRFVTVWYSPEAKANVKIRTHGTYEGSVTTVNNTRELQSYKVQ